MFMAFRFATGIAFGLTVGTSLAATTSARHLVDLPTPQFVAPPSEVYTLSHPATAGSSLQLPNKRGVAPSQKLAFMSPKKLNTLNKTTLGKMEEVRKLTPDQARRIKTIPKASIIRVHDCLLTATIYTGNWNVECMRSGSTNEESWQNSGWQITPLARKVVPQEMWPVCTWLNGFGYDQLITTPDLNIDRRLGDVTRRKNIFVYRHGYEVSGGVTIITRLGRHCPKYGESVKKAPQQPQDWSRYLDLL